MTEPCTNCPRYKQCTDICQEVEKDLERRFKESKNSFGTREFGRQSLSGLESDSIHYWQGSNKEVTNIIHEKTSLKGSRSSAMPESLDLDYSTMQKLEEIISQAIPSNNKRLRRQFSAFRKCEMIASIASKAGTTKQNIQKKFQSVMRKIKNVYISKSNLGKRETGRDVVFKEVNTPYKFKRLVAKND